MLKEGWTFEDYPGSTPDTVNGFHCLHELYTASIPDYTGRVSVPVLWDTITHQIVSNESADIILMFNDVFDSPSTPDLYPETLRTDIEAINLEVYDKVNNGVYKVGLARRQDAHEESARALFKCLDWLEDRLGRQRYLVGDTFTTADIRLFTTLVRFDPVYFVHFKCSLRLLSSYHNLSNYLREIYQMPGVAVTVNMDHIKAHYYRSHLAINPFGIVPIGPVPDLTLPHDRNRLPGGLKVRRVAGTRGQGNIWAVAEVLITPLLAWLSL
jgi:putative glutathione S-transferase